MKTRKSLSKRFRITKSGKVLKRIAGQSHYNARESSVITLNKRKSQKLPASYKKVVKCLALR